jgi:hypothetical protein
LIEKIRAVSTALANFFASAAQPANISPDVHTAFDNSQLSLISKKRRVLGAFISSNFSDI